MTRSHRYIGLIVLLAFIPAVGYVVMHGITYVFPMGQDTTFTHLAYTVIIIALGLAVPYWALKTLGAASRQRNRHEKDFHLEDLPKDKDRL